MNETLAVSVADRLRKEILQRSLSAGDVLMTEAEVADHFSVSRTIAREAVSRLRALGILESRQAKGLLVARPRPSQLLAHTLPFAGSGPGYRQHLGEYRFALEVGAIDLAVRHTTEAQAKRLRETAERFAAARQAGRWQDEADLEIAFHATLLEMTGNGLLAGMHQVLVDYFQNDAEASAGGPDESVWQHRAIAEAVRQRDAEQARALLRQHLAPLVGRSTAEAR